MDDNTLKAIKEIKDFFKKTTQTWGFLIILGSFPIFYASQPGMWEYIYSFLANTNSASPSHPENNIPIFMIACIVLLFGIYIAYLGTKEKQERVTFEYHDRLKNELKMSKDKRNNSVIQSLFLKLYKYEPPVSIIEVLYNCNDVSGATYYFKYSRKYTQDKKGAIAIDRDKLASKKKVLSIWYFLISLILAVLLTSDWWLPSVLEENKAHEAIGFVILLYVLFMIPIGILISKLKKVTSALHLSDILKSNEITKTS